MIQPVITVDERQVEELQRILKDLPERMIPRAIRSAINRSVTRLRSRMVKSAATIYRVKQKTLRERVWGSKAKRSLVGRVKAGSVGWPLGDFSPKQTDQGVTAKVYGGRTVVRDAFMAKMPRSGHEGVWKRRTRKRLPIYEARTPSLTETLRRHAMVEPLARDAQETFEAELYRYANHLAEKHGIKASAAEAGLSSDDLRALGAK